MKPSLIFFGRGYGSGKPDLSAAASDRRDATGDPIYQGE